MPNLFTRLKRLSSCGNAFSNSTTLTKIINIKTLYDLKSSYCILSNSRTRVFFDLLHIFFIIYNTFALPFYIGFAIELSTAVLLLEIAYISENLIHILVELKTSQYIDGILTTDITTLLKNYTKTGLIFLDIFCILPLNLSLMPYYNIYTSLIRITRISQSFYLNFYLKGLESNNRAFAPFIAIFKAFFVLACIWHWSSCYWFWINECVEGGAKAEEQSWFLANHLDKEGLAYQYAMALYFSMNIATTANFPDQSPMNNTERVCFFIMIYVGDACFATAFAIISSNTAVFPLKFNEIFKSINRLRLMLQDSKVSNHVLKRMEEYYAFLVKLRQQNQSSLISLKNYIPEHMFQELRYLIAKPFLINFPIFNGLKSPMLLREVAEKLEYAMYLPRDYIIFRNDIGEEMYFIIEGNVLVMTPREDTVIVILKKGNFFGEIALFTESSRRICSVISGSFCELFVLNKIYLTRILDHHPHIKDLFQKESDRRMAEYRGQSLVNKSLKKIKEYNFPRNKPKRSLSFNITKINDENNIDDFLIEDLAPKAQKIVSYADNKEKDQKIKITRWKTNNFISKSLLRKELSFKIPKNSFGNVDHEESRPNIVENGFNSIGIKINETPKSPDRELLSPEIKSPSSPSKIFDKSKNNNLLLAKSQKNSPFGKKFLFLMENFDSDEGKK